MNDIEEVKRKKVELERSIYNLVVEFEKETGASIGGLDIIYMESVIPCHPDKIVRIRSIVNIK